MADLIDPADFVIRQTQPLNAEPLPGKLITTYLTPQHLLYVRSHGGTPELSADHAITIDGDGLIAMRLTLADLKARFPERRVVATIQCAGNRRADLQAVRATNGDPWHVGAIGNVAWTGVSLADVLRAAGLGDRRDGFVACTCADEEEIEGTRAPYGISIPLERAMHDDVLIAWAIGDEPLSPEHGAPMRLVVPGYAGVRSAKWLTHITVQDTPSEAPIQAKDYKLFPPDEDGDAPDWDSGLTINAMPVTSAICSPCDGDTVRAGAINVRGYAIAYDRRVAQVDVSADDGGTWHRATFDDDAAPHAWQRWTCTLHVSPGRHRLVVRAVDEAGQTQPSQPADVWNFAGYLSTAWHRITITSA